MAADWDSGGYGTDAQADAVTTRETRPAPGVDADWDTDPDTENYAEGNDPETAYREQGRPASPDNWSGHDSADITDQEPEPHENDGRDDLPDLWGDADPDAANYADLDAAVTTAELPDQGDQQRISALEAENAAARQKIADLEAKNDEQAARLDRIEQLLAGPARQPDATAPPEHTDNMSATKTEHAETALVGDFSGTESQRTDAGDHADRGQRPDVVAQYPHDYVRSPEPPPDVAGPHEHPEGWAASINPGKDAPGRDNNCGECSRAVDNTWSGHPITAAALADGNAYGEPVVRMADWAGASPAQATMADVSKRLGELGPGSSAVVGCDWKHGSGHWFNAVNDGGTVKAVDGQSGCVEAWPPSPAGLGFDESDMGYSDAIFFSADGKVVK